jgi:hypothetical protein
MAAFEVLLVEDSPGDVRLAREAFKDAKVHINLLDSQLSQAMTSYVAESKRCTACLAT